MTGILDYISSSFFQKPVSPDPSKTQWTYNLGYKFTSMTGTFLFFASCLVFARELIGDHIHCISDATNGRIPQDGFESYCYISNTFTLPSAEVIGNAGHPNDLSNKHPGLGPIQNEDGVVYHNYYMWVPYFLFFQSLSLFVPRLLYRFYQDRRIECVLAGKGGNNDGLWNIDPWRQPREDAYGDIGQYFQDWYNNQNWWAIKLVLCDVLNVIVIILNMFFIDWYLSYNFFLYGPQSVEYMATPPESRGLDPFNILFPKMTKCTLNTYGPSGTIQKHDGLCILPVNVFNEKLYLFIWFLLIGLGVFVIFYTLIGGIIMMNRDLRKSFLLLYILPDRKDMKRKLSRILDLTGFGDWMIFYLLAKNVDRVVFTQIMDMGMNYPDYDYDAEPLDHVNKRLEDYHKGNEDDIVKPNSEKKRFLKKL